MKQSYETHAAFDLDALPVTKLTKVLRNLGERGDFARVLKVKQIALIEAHSVEDQAAALANIGEEPEALRLADHTPEADHAIQMIANAAASNDDDWPERAPARAAPPPLIKARPKQQARSIAQQAPPVVDVPITAPPEDEILAYERGEQRGIVDEFAPLDEAAPELEQVALMLARLLVAGRRAIDRELITEVVRSELARRPNAWSDSD